MSITDVIVSFLMTPIVAGLLLLGIASAFFGSLLLLVRKMTFKP